MLTVYQNMGAEFAEIFRLKEYYDYLARPEESNALTNKKQLTDEKRRRESSLKDGFSTAMDITLLQNIVVSGVRVDLGKITPSESK